MTQDSIQSHDANIEHNQFSYFCHIPFMFTDINSVSLEIDPTTSHVGSQGSTWLAVLFFIYIYICGLWLLQYYVLATSKVI